MSLHHSPKIASGNLLLSLDALNIKSIKDLNSKINVLTEIIENLKNNLN